MRTINKILIITLSIIFILFIAFLSLLIIIPSSTLHYAPVAGITTEPDSLTSGPLSLEPLSRASAFNAELRYAATILDSAAIAFDTPERMRLDEPKTLHLYMEPHRSAAELMAALEAEGLLDVPEGRPMERGAVPVSDYVQAHLAGSAFAIDPVTPEEQIVSLDARSEWIWDVTPKRAGHHVLHLTLTAYLNVQGSTFPRRIRTFEREIEIEVSGWQLFKENWDWLWTLLILPFAALGRWAWVRHAKPVAVIPPQEAEGAD